MKTGLGLGLAAKPAGKASSSGGSGTIAQPITPATPDLKLTFTKASPDGFGDFSFSRASPATYPDAGGRLAIAAANVPRFAYYGSSPAGLKKEFAATNLCTNFNANPDAGLTGISVGGDPAAGVTAVADPGGLLAGAVNRYGFVNDLSAFVCTSGKVIKLDNSAGTGPAWVEFAGSAGSTSTTTCGSIYARCPAGSALSYGATAATAAVASPSALTELVLPGFTPADTTSKLRLTIPAGGVAYAILNQLETGFVPSSKIVTTGAAATRASEYLSLSNADTKAYFGQQSGAINVGFDVDDPTNLTQTFFAIQNGTSSANSNANNLSNSAIAGLSRTKNTSFVGSARPNLTVGKNAGQPNTYIGSIDGANLPNHSGMIWNTAAGSMIATSGALDTQIHTVGSFPVAWNRLDIGGKANGANLMNGHVRSITIWKTAPTVPQFGQQLDFQNWAVITSNGQSNLASSWDAEGVVGTDYGANFNDGEKAIVAEMQKYWPGRRCAIAHMASSGSSISYGNASGTAGNAWYDYASGVDQPLMSRAIDIATGLVQGGAEIVGHFINGHESDTAQSYAGLMASFNHVCGKLWALPAKLGTTKTIKDVPTVYQPFGRRTNGTGNDNPYQHMRLFQRAFVAANANVTMGTERWDIPMESTGTHLTDLGNATQQPREVRLLASLCGIAVPGPVSCIDIASAQFVSATTIRVVFKLPAGITDFSPAAGIQDFTFWDQATAPGPDQSPSVTRTPFASAVRVDYRTVDLTLATAPTTSGLLDSHFGDGYTNTAAAPNTYAPVDPTKMVVGNDARKMPLRSRTMLLPFAA